MMRAAVYARKSSDNEAGVERQVEIAKDFIAKKEWLPGPVYQDNAISGATFDRPGLNELLAAVAAKPRPFDVLVMMNVDRLSRGTIAETLALQQRILKAGVEIWFYQTGQRVTLDSATDELKGAIDAYGARDFRDQIKAKTKAALRKKAEQGHAVGGAAFGYKLVRVGDHVEREIVPEQAAVVVRIFTMAAEGVGYRKIANTLNSEHALAPGPKGWSKDAIGRVVANELYIGVSVWETVRAELPDLRIVSDDLWTRAQARKEQTKEAYRRNARGQLLSKPESGLASKYALSGIARCYACGAGLKAFPATAKDVARYRCSERARRGAAACVNTAGIPVATVDFAFAQTLHELLTQDPDTLADILDERDARLEVEQESRGDVRAIALAKAAELEKQIARLVDLAASGKAPESVLQGIADRERQVAELKATPAPPPRFDRAAFREAYLKSFGAKSYGLPLLMKPQQMRAAMRKLGIDRVIPRPDARPDGQGGWTYEGSADLAGLLTNVAPEERAG